MTLQTDLIRMTAREAVGLLARGELSPLELLEASIERIRAVDPAINAIPNRCFDRAWATATRLMEQGVPKEPPSGWLGGLPIAIKDYYDVAGVPTTHGDPERAEDRPARSDPMVEHVEACGAVIVGKTNVPYDGLVPETWNPLYGITRNPWDTSLSPGRSSGGSGAAVAAGEVWLASGSDLGGSVRLPATCCSVVGMRTSLGRVSKINPYPFGYMSVHGPMARNVRDAALFLDAMAGADERDPLGQHAPRESFLSAAEAARTPVRVGFTTDYGIANVAPEVVEICRAVAVRMEAIGVQVDEACPDFGDASRTVRGLRMADNRRNVTRERFEEMRPHLDVRTVEFYEASYALTMDEFTEAQRAQTRLLGRMQEFFERYDLLIGPVQGTPPQPLCVEEQPGGGIIVKGRGGGVTSTSMGTAEYSGPLTYHITITGSPALSLPAGFTADGRPVGIQIVAPPQCEHRLLSAAAAIEDALGIAGMVPVEPRVVGTAAARVR